MEHFPSVETLGHRICILGPSNSGKSTLASRLSAKSGIPCYHLDQFAHYPGTDWRRRPAAELSAAQDEIIAQPAWIIDGNYKICMKERLAYATTILWIDPPLPGCIGRYLLRCLKGDANRPGRLQEAKKEFSWEMIRYTLIEYPKNRRHYQALIAQYPHLRLVKFKSIGALNRFYKDNQL